ncbi:hypothetical protein [Arsenicibacter rosenii]|uniref:Uncharacterized protein n=1 Tax=Arsenicibacter rosenii TaxID=1750698 RepID=A0A1S2VQ61_9BACT|nr:hypothetical protein [Arsenicibacter rosenii]OIN59938.1 hypothetical protein BLX24_08845 [Arsenicibacter rosenii]
MKLNFQLYALRLIDKESPAIKKDAILEAIKKTEHMGKNIYQFAEQIHYSVYAVNYYCHILKDEGYINAIEITSRQSFLKNELMIDQITDKGIVFLEDGGFIRSEFRQKMKDMGTTILVLITTINATAATVIALLAYGAADDTKKLNKQLEEKNKMIDSTNRVLSTDAKAINRLLFLIDSLKVKQSKRIK